VALFINPEQPASFPEILPLFLYFTKTIFFITHYLISFKVKILGYMPDGNVILCLTDLWTRERPPGTGSRRI